MFLVERTTLGSANLQRSTKVNSKNCIPELRNNSVMEAGEFSSITGGLGVLGLLTTNLDLGPQVVASPSETHGQNKNCKPTYNRPDSFY